MQKHLWLFCLFLIFFFSAVGRPLQKWVGPAIGQSGVRLLFGVPFVAIGAGFLFWTIKKSRTSFVYFLWVPLVCLGLSLSTNDPDEILHYILFGILGFCLVESFGLQKLRKIIFILIICSISDEQFQTLFPRRFFDWLDVSKNMIGGTLGILAGVQFKKVWLQIPRNNDQ